MIQNSKPNQIPIWIWPLPNFQRGNLNTQEQTSKTNSKCKFEHYPIFLNKQFINQGRTLSKRKSECTYCLKGWKITNLVSRAKITIENPKAPNHIRDVNLTPNHIRDVNLSITKISLTSNLITYVGSLKTNCLGIYSVEIMIETQ